MRSVLITGAYGGMGRATAQRLRAQGYRVFALDCRTEAHTDGIVPVQADLCDEQSVCAAYEAVRAQTDSLCAIVHFAGIYCLDSLLEMDCAAYDRIFDINVRGAFLVNRTFFPLLEKGSRILLTTSELAPLDPLPFTGIYAVTKAALDKYAYALRMELQLLDISVSVLRAGAVQTDMLGASTNALARFCEKTQLYPCNAKRFSQIVERVEARCVPPARLAKKVTRILKKKRPAFAYAINRNPLLRLLNLLPRRMQLWVIRKILKSK